ncbi:MAG: hypothetical protein D6707_02925, partial [Bacteroidetes bacterium]
MADTNKTLFTRQLLRKEYELTEFEPNILMSNDFYPFGMLTPGRVFNSGEYRFGYGSHEKIDEVSGSGNTIDMGDRWLDTRVGRTYKLDAKADLYPGVSPYTYAANNPIIFIDPDG